MSARQTLGQKIRALRKAKGLTQQQLAEPHFTKSFISQIEKDSAKPSLKSLQIMAERLGKPVSYFLEDPTPTTTPQIPEKVFHLITLAQKLEENKLPQDAHQYYQEALELVATESTHLRCRILTYIARTAAAMENYQLALDQYLRAMDGFASVCDRHSAAKAGIEAGLLYYTQGHLDKAIELLSKANDMLEPTEGDTGFWSVFAQLHLGLIHRQRQEPAKALESLQRAWETCLQYKTFVRYGQVVTEIGLLYRDEGDLDRALSFLSKAAAFYQGIDNQQEEARCQILSVDISIRLGAVEGMESQLRDALNTLQFWVYPQETYLGHLLLAEIAANHRNFTEALELMETAREFAQGPEQTLQAGVRVGKYLRLAGKTADSLTVLQGLEGDENSTQTSKQLQAELYSELADTYTALGQDETAAEYLRKSLELYRSITP
ncbi:MAG: helix-turn-helix domain-containing protein [Firmicutes bacterium]|nr:helix-turn-helix domain-containing protein [Bacillota bacterium]